MKIAIDLDDTLINFAEQLIHFHNHNHGTDYKFEEFHSFLFHEVWGGTRLENLDEVDSFYKSAYFKNIKPLLGAVEAVEKLSKDNELYIITSRRTNAFSITKAQVDLFFPGKFKDIYCVGQYSIDEKPTSKAEICDNLNIQILIEDSVENANSCFKDGRKIFAFNRPWNKNAEVHQGIMRVNSWLEVLNQIYKSGEQVYN